MSPAYNVLDWPSVDSIHYLLYDECARKRRLGGYCSRARSRRMSEWAQIDVTSLLHLQGCITVSTGPNIAERAAVELAML